MKGSPTHTPHHPLTEQVTFAINPSAFNTDHHLYIDSVYDVSPPGGPGVLASFLWNDDAFELLSKVGAQAHRRMGGWVTGAVSCA